MYKQNKCSKQNKCTNKINSKMYKHEQTEYMYQQNKSTNKINVQTK